jgi:3-phytase
VFEPGDARHGRPDPSWPGVFGAASATARHARSEPAPRSSSGRHRRPRWQPAAPGDDGPKARRLAFLNDAGYQPRHVKAVAAERKVAARSMGSGPHPRQSFPTGILISALVGVIAFVAVGIGIAGALRGRNEPGPAPAAVAVQPGQATGGAVAPAVCQRAPDEQSSGSSSSGGLALASYTTPAAQQDDDSPPPPGAEVTASGGTDRLGDGDLGDVALWVDQASPERSTVIASDKDCNRLFVYDLAGNMLQSLSLGPVTQEHIDGAQGVDLRRGVKLGGHSVDVVAVTDQSKGQLDLFMVDPSTRTLRNIAARPIRTTRVNYGVCLYSSVRTGELYAFVTQESEDKLGAKGGLVEQWALFDKGGKLDAQRQRTFDSGGEAKGCVADDERGVLYLANKETGISRWGAEPDDPPTRQARVAQVRVGGHLFADVEGLALVKTGPADGYLIASSQGSNSFAAYDRRTGKWVKDFHLTDQAGSLVKDPSGIEATGANLGPAFPKGLFATQDGGTALRMAPLDKILPE